MLPGGYQQYASGRVLRVCFREGIKSMLPGGYQQYASGRVLRVCFREGIKSMLREGINTIPQTGGDDGSMSFYDWKTGQNFQQIQTTPQPGSLDCEAAIYAAAFDVTGLRLVTCEADKTVKMWKQETNK
ncbi:hypothetical protein POM88_053005 [Heracleum sosnowskyi]|uniref:Uncharacterized protein n=1 Tax=Heracleum sosnowskyi TaxID=360622 RepID=A0AAD8GQE3_9APIA|nr:hypothetical protein POM88_053005 [Heracleum sosnowskyi]